MGVIATTDQVPANVTITYTFSCIIGPLTTPSAAQQNIANAFAGTGFNVTSIQFPLLASPVVQGSFVDVDGAGHSNMGSNLLGSDVAAFFLQVMASVSGLYQVSVDSIQSGAVAASLGNTLGGGGSGLPAINWTYVGVGGAVLLLLIVFVVVATKEVI